MNIMGMEHNHTPSITVVAGCPACDAYVEMMLKATDRANESLRRESPMTWQPIATAPKDGTEILVSDGQSTWLTYWTEVDEPELHNWFSHDYDGLTMGIREPLTHWMHKPEPPK